MASSSTASSDEYVNLVTVRGGDHAIAGTLVGPKGEPRITMIDDLAVDLPPARNLLVVRNDDRPGMIATVTAALAEARRSTSTTCASATTPTAPPPCRCWRRRPRCPDVGAARRTRRRDLQSVHVLTD